MTDITLFCQSCGAKLTIINMGMETNGTLNTDYCYECYDNGEFTSEITMEQMIDNCIALIDTWEIQCKPEEGRRLLHVVFPWFKRWRSQSPDPSRTAKS